MADLVSLSRRGVIMAAACLPWRALRTGAAAVTELRIASDGDELAFLPDRLTCAAGAAVRLVFHHAGEIVSDAHDWVLLKHGAEASFIADADRASEEDFVPGSDPARVLAATPRCAKGGTVMVDFVAPAPGDYMFVCSMPGHAAQMNGILAVT